MAAEQGRWQLYGFLERFDIWVQVELPPAEVELAVMLWLHGLIDDPYPGARRVEGFENLWDCPVPGTLVDGSAVLASFFVRETGSSIRCNDIATLSWPF